MSFQQGLSGLNAASKNLDTIGNNVANASTVGFKSSIAVFADVFANSLVGAGSNTIGIGTSVADIAQQFNQGNISVTNNPLDIAINGNGFFRMSQNGAITYSRNGQFHLDKDGYIVNSQGFNLTGYPADPNGVIMSGAMAPLQLTVNTIPPTQTTQADIQANLDSRGSVLPAAGFNMNDPTTYHSTTSMTTYDSLGNAHTLTLYFVKTAVNPGVDATWNVFAANDGVQIGAGSAGQLVFQPNGQIDTGASTFPSTIAMTSATGAYTPYNVNVDFTGTTQFGSVFSVGTLSQDGYSAGQLTGFSIGADGTILARYSNGKSQAQGQVLVSNFKNPNGLQPLGNNQWGETAESGQPLTGTPQSGNLGALQSGAVEDSNVDLTAELVNMITAQRVYQANAQTIKTQDAIMQTLVNLR